MGTNEVSRRRDEMPAREEGEGKGKGKGGGGSCLGNWNRSRSKSSLFRHASLSSTL